MLVGVHSEVFVMRHGTESNEVVECSAQ